MYHVGIGKLKIRGMIASEDIRAGTIIEICPTLLSPVKDYELLSKTILECYFFDWNKQYDALVFGYGSMINHSNNPNAKYHRDYKNKTLIISAIKEIKSGEEVLVNYNGNPTSQVEWKFERAEK